MHIDKLILDGFDLPAADHEVLRAALVEALTGMLAAGGLDHTLASGGAMYRIPVPPMGTVNPVNPGEMGRQIAGTIYAGLSTAEQSSV